MTRFVSHIDLKMRYVAAALLLALAEDKITAENIEKILSSVGVESDKEKLALVRNTLNRVKTASLNRQKPVPIECRFKSQSFIVLI